MATVSSPELHDVRPTKASLWSMPEPTKSPNANASQCVVVIGAGWAGWGAAKALCDASVRVTLAYGMPDPKREDADAHRQR